MPSWLLPREPPCQSYWKNPFPCSMRVQLPIMTWAACIGEASGSEEVPDPIRVSGMPRGPARISMECRMSICARSGDAAPAISTSKSLRMPRSPQAKVEKRAPLARRGRTTPGMTDLGLRWWRERWGEVGDEAGAWSQNSRTGCGTQADRHLGPHPRRGTARRARAPGSAAESGCVLVARLARRLSHECGEMCGVLMRRGSVVTRVHVARGCRLRKQADAHR